jgi:hypothetical protein
MSAAPRASTYRDEAPQGAIEMTAKLNVVAEFESGKPSSAPVAKREYQVPRLRSLGTVAQLTLGSATTATESLVHNVRKFKP